MEEDKEFVPFDLTIPSAIEEGRKELKEELKMYLNAKISMINDRLTNIRESVVINQFDVSGRINQANLVGSRDAYELILNYLERY